MPTRLPSPSRRGFFVGGLTALTLTTGAGAWALDRYVVDHVEVADASAYEASQGSDGAELDTSQAVLTDDSWTRTAPRSRCSRSHGSGSRRSPTSSPSRAQRRHRAALGVRQDAFGTNIIETTSDIAARQRRGLRDQRRLLRLPRHRHRHPQRRRLPRLRRPRKDSRSTATAGRGVRRDRDQRRRTRRRRRLEHPVLRPGAASTTARSIDGIDGVEVDTNFGNHSIQGEQPRTAVGVIDANHLVFVVVDGRSNGYSRA